jgi:membrane-associated phospholipid phosphatase
MNKNKLLFLILLLHLFFLSNVILPQTSNVKDSTGNFFDGVFHDVKIGLADGGHLASAPFNFSERDWLISAGIISGTALSFLLDENLRRDTQNHQAEFLNDFTKPGKYYGAAVNAIALSGVLYFGGKVIDNEDISSTGRMLTESLVYSGLTTLFFKLIFGRSRPFTNEGHGSFHWFETKNEYNSFPSGDVTIAFAISSVLAERINNVYASIGLYGLAGLTLMQRIYTDQHWFSDTVFAAAVTTVISRAIVGYENDRKKKNNLSRISIYPLLINNQLGVGISLCL